VRDIRKVCHQDGRDFTFDENLSAQVACSSQHERRQVGSRVRCHPCLGINWTSECTSHDKLVGSWGKWNQIRRNVEHSV